MSAGRPRVHLFTDSADPSGMGVHMLTLARALREEADLTLLFADTPAARPFAARARADEPGLKTYLDNRVRRDFRD